MSSEGSDEIVDLHLPVAKDADIDGVLDAMDAHGIAHGVLAPVGRWAAVDNAEAHDALLARLRRHPDRLSAWATVNPWYGARACDELRRAFDEGLVGLRIEPALQGHRLLSAVLEPVLDVVAEYAKPIYAVTGVPVAGEPLQLAELALRRPGIVFVMGRSGRTDFSLDLLPALESTPNLVAETTYNSAGLIADFVARLGASRVTFASDFPRNDLGAELARLSRTSLDADERRFVLGESARRLIGAS